jgi:hypothetical protein
MRNSSRLPRFDESKGCTGERARAADDAPPAGGTRPPGLPPAVDPLPSTSLERRQQTLSHAGREGDVSHEGTPTRPRPTDQLEKLEVPAVAAAVLAAAARQLLARPSPPPECRSGAFLPARPLRGRCLSRRFLRYPLLNLLAACRTDALFCLIIPRAQPAGEAVRRHSRPPRCRPAQTLLAASEQLEPG